MKLNKRLSEAKTEQCRHRHIERRNQQITQMPNIPIYIAIAIPQIGATDTKLIITREVLRVNRIAAEKEEEKKTIRICVIYLAKI